MGSIRAANRVCIESSVLMVCWGPDEVGWGEERAGKWRSGFGFGVRGLWLMRASSCFLEEVGTPIFSWELGRSCRGGGGCHSRYMARWDPC